MPTRTKKSAGSSKKSIQVDFSETESRGGKKGRARAHYPPNDYAVKVVKAELGKSTDKGTPGIFITYKITSPAKYKGKTISDSLWLTSSALWRVRNALEAMGINVPSKKIDIHPEKMVGKECGITLDDEEYDEKVYSRVVDTFLLSEMDAEDAELDTDEDEDEDEDEEEDEEDEDEDEDEEEDDDEDEDDLDSIDI